MKHLEFDETRDFPYYNHNPRISKKGWLILLILAPTLLMGYSYFSEDYPIILSIIFCFGLLIPLLGFSDWNYSAIFKKPSENELKLAFLMFVGYIIYSIVVSTALDYLGLYGLGLEEVTTVNIAQIASLFFSMMGEELIKFIPMMFFMRVIFKHTNKRDLSFAMSAALVMFGFAFLHYYPPYTTVPSVLLLQGLGSIFEIYGYVKTKNLWVSYISHLLTDLFLLSLMFLVN